MGDDKKQTFDESLARLEEIVRLMESGESNLEESLALYEEGVKKAGELETMLVDAREKVMKLVTDKNGDTKLEPFSEDETA